MKTKPTLLSTMVMTTFLITACGGSATPTEVMMSHDATATEAMMAHETSTPDAMMAKETPTTEAMMEAPAWYSASLSDARTGQAFAIQDFKGKVVLVEAMAIWCPKCLQQQGQVKALHGLLGQRDDFVSIGLDIDPNEDSASLKAYVENNGFDWLYAVPAADVSSELSSLYGGQFLNPPSTPILVIDRHGEAHVLPFGIKSADELLQFIQPFLDEAM